MLGNFISGKILDLLKKKFNIKIYKDDKDIEIKLPSGGSGGTKVNEHVYFYLEYRSRTERRILRACVKAYAIQDLAVPIVTEKTNLRANA